MSLSQRFANGLRFLRSTRQILEAGIRTRNPDWTDEKVAAEMRLSLHDAGD